MMEPPTIPRMPEVNTKILWAVALLAGLGIMARKSDDLLRTFEVSSFGLSEDMPDGRVRRLLWGNGVLLRNRPWLRRIELAVEGQPGRIGIPYRVVGFEQLVSSIMSRGGFEAESDKP
jgi:hypothetical protein